MIQNPVCAKWETESTIIQKKRKLHHNLKRAIPIITYISAISLTDKKLLKKHLYDLQKDT